MAGILRNWYLSKLAKSKSPYEYFLTLQQYMIYEYSIFNSTSDKYI
jgi:hypothetical protein